jgi:hypothetical protein
MPPKGYKSPTSKYDKHLTYVQENLLSKGFDAVAKGIGVTTDALKKQITYWRRNGIKIPHLLRNVEIGRITIRKEGCSSYRFQKTENGWVRLERVSPYRPKKEKIKSSKPTPNPMPRKRLKPKVSKEDSPIFRVKPNDEKCYIRENERTEPIIMVRLNQRTEVIRRLTA